MQLFLSIITSALLSPIVLFYVKWLYPFRCLKVSTTFCTQVKYFCKKKKKLLRLVSILFFFSEPMVISDARICQSDQWNDHTRATLSPTERITLSKCFCWTFVLKSPLLGLVSTTHELELHLATDKKLSKGRNMKTSSFLEVDLFLTYIWNTFWADNSLENKGNHTACKCRF